MRTVGAGLFVAFLLPMTAHGPPHYEVTMTAALAYSVPAQVELGELYRRGRSVAPDLIQAYAWLNLVVAKRSSAAVQREEVAACLESADGLKAQLLSFRLLGQVALAKTPVDRGP